MPENISQPDSGIDNPAISNARDSAGEHAPDALRMGNDSSLTEKEAANNEAHAKEILAKGKSDHGSSDAATEQMPPDDCQGKNPDQLKKSAGLPPETSQIAQTTDNGAEPAGETEPEAEKTMGLLDHLSELRQRLTKSAIAAACGFAVCWIFVDPLFNILMAPLLAVLPDGAHAQYTTLPEAFFTRMRVAFVAGLFLSSPIIFYQIWAFVAPGLYDEEKRHILPIAFFSAIFFIAGGLFCYFIVFPFAFNFFISYSTPEIVITPKISDYLSFCLKLIFAFGLIFEMPIFTFFLARLGIVTASMMRRARKYAVVGIFILAAILTPPDVVSQILMACPMLLLYEASIWVAAIFGKKHKKADSTENQDNGA